MGRNYDLLNKSDMRRFARDLEKDIKAAAKKSLISNGLNVDCPFCKNAFRMVSGENVCPACGNTATVSFDWSKM